MLFGSTERISTPLRFNLASFTDSLELQQREQKNRGGHRPPLFHYATLLPEPTSLEHDAEGNRHELHRTSVGRHAVVARFDERMENRQRQVDTSAGVPAEVVVSLARSTSNRCGRHVESSAADQVRRNADARQTPYDVTRRARDVELGRNTRLLTKLVVRAIDAQTNRDEGEVDGHCNGTVVTDIGAGLQVAHWLSGAASNTKAERLQYAELRIRDARSCDECDRGDREEQ